MNEGIVEGGEDAGNAENELACSMSTLVSLMITKKKICVKKKLKFVQHTITGEGAEGDVLLSGGSLLGRGHCDCGVWGLVDGIWKRRSPSRDG